MQHKLITPQFLNNDSLRPIVRNIIAIITLLVGMSDMLSAIVPRLSSIVSSEFNIFFISWPLVDHRVPAQNFTVVIGFFLIVLSYGLMRGKKHAHSIALILLLLSALLHVQRSGSVLATFVALLLATLLLGFRHFFQAKSDPPCARRGYVTLCIAAGIVIFYLIGGFILLYNDFEPLVDRMGVESVLLHLIYNQRWYTCLLFSAHFPRTLHQCRPL
jgi:phosphatidylglycerol lysyltransferase